jgi:glycosyltransferase involved in cell wall biosynthesis
MRRAVHSALDEYGPDVVVLPGWWTRPALAGLGWCLKNRVPRVLISDSQAIDTPQNFLKTRAKRLLVRQFQAGLVGGAPHQRFLTQLGMDTNRCFRGCDVVNNRFFDQEQSGSVRRRSRQDNRGSLLSCLRLLPRKNCLAVLEALAGDARQWTWTITGDGPQRPEIQQRIADLGLEDRVFLEGHVEYARLPSYYDEADVYLQPSLSEPWGLAVNEAMASGKPVLVSNRCGCHEDLVREGVNGHTFDPASPESLAHALDRLWAEKDRWAAMGAASRQIISQWDLGLFAKNLWAACRTALEPAPAGWTGRGAGMVLRSLL